MNNISQSQVQSSLPPAVRPQEGSFLRIVGLLCSVIILRVLIPSSERKVKIGIFISIFETKNKTFYKKNYKFMLTRIKTKIK